MDKQKVADYLLKEGYLLTALELHVELSEKGSALPSLTTFFKESKNFESFISKTSPQSSVSGSQAGLDDVSSLFDLTRNSEDSHVQAEDRVAVLEFELRKARETIFNLREELTSKVNQNQDHDSDTIDINEQSDDEYEDENLVMKAHEKRIVNFLINEYLLQHGYKLTSITFSDENTEADYFEDWDSIGINVTKPPNLLRLYRDYGKHFEHKQVNHVEINTDPDPEWQNLKRKSEENEEEIQGLQSKIQCLTSNLEQQKSSNDQLGTQLKEKESLIDILKSSQTIKSSSLASSVSSTEILEIIPPGQFYQHLKNKCPQIDQDWYLNQDLVHELAQGLPKIVPNILLNKREELLPLLIIAIQHHPDSKTRDQLLNLLFNLTKKPELEQRKVILKGFKGIARTLGHQKLESELLPQLWEQLNHKYDERRILVAETCSVILPYIPNALTNSLVLSMLQQLSIEDKCIQVRSSAISSLSLLVLHLTEDANKHELIAEMLKTLLNDPSDEIVNIVQDQFLPAVLKWYFDKDFSTLDIVQARLDEFASYCDHMDHIGTPILMQKIQTLRLILPFILALLIKNMPESPKPDSDVESDDLIEMILEGHSDKNLGDLKAVLQKEWYESWKTLEWLKSEWLTIVIQALAQVPGPLDIKVIEAFSELFKDHFDYLGPNFVRDHLAPKFNQYLPPPTMLEAQQEFSAQEIKTYQSCLLPVFVQGVLVKIDTPTDIADKLQDLAISYCTNPVLKSWPISTSIQVLVLNHSDPGYRDAIAEMAWTLLVHPESSVKMIASMTLESLAQHQGDEGDLIGHKILPGLVTLSSDPDPEVRSSSLKGLAQVVIGSSLMVMETREKAAFQLVSFIIVEQEFEVGVQKSAIEAIGHIITKDKCPHKLRDDLFLPKLLDFINAQK